MAIPRFLGRNALGRYVGLSDTRITQLNPPPDATVDGRPVWSEETATRLKREREARAAQRGGRRERAEAAA